MPTKTPSKGKAKAGAKDKPAKDSAKESAKESKRKKAEPVRASQTEDGDGDGDEDDDEDDEDFAKPVKPAGKTAKAKSDAEPAAIVPARRLTPEAKQRVNEMVAKGMSLTDALKAAASWETFVAPVREEPVHAMPGFGDGRPRRPRGGGDDDDARRQPNEDEDIEPTGGIDTDD